MSEASEAERAQATASNPYSSGGGGETFERRVAVLYLTKLLTGATSVELEGRRVVQVSFQQGHDLVIHAARDEEAEPSLELSVEARRAPKFVQSDGDTEALLTKFLRALQGLPKGTDVDHRFAISVAGPQTAAQQVARLAALAKDHQADSFFKLVRSPGRLNKKLRERLEHLVELVTAGLTTLDEQPSGAATEQTTWNLLSRLLVLMPRVEPPDETDWAELLNRLEPWSRGQTVAAATDLRNEFESLAARLAPQAAVVNLASLRRELHDVINLESRRNKRGWASLRRLDQDARKAVRTEMGPGTGLHLERSAEVSRLRKRLGDDPYVLVSGDSGVGKSTVVLGALASAVEADSQGVQVVFLNLRFLPPTIPELRSTLGCPVEDAFAELSAPSRLLVLDSTEYVTESRPSRDLLRHLVRTAKTREMAVWIVSTTEGKAAVRTAVETIVSPLIEHPVADLRDEDLETVTATFPQLQSLATEPRSKELLRRPVVTDFLLRAGSTSHPLSEADALEVVWEKLVRADGRSDRGEPDSREQVCRRLALQALNPGPTNDLYSSLDAAALSGLRRDDILRTPSSARWKPLPEFSHDQIRTYAVTKVLLEDGEPVTALLDVGAPRWALPAARLAAQVLLSAPESPDLPLAGRFEHTQADFDRLAAEGHGERWSDLPTEALLTLPQAGTILGDAWDFLLTEKATGLRRVLRILKLRHRSGGLAKPLVAEPVIELLLERSWPRSLDEEVEALLRDWLGALIVANVQAGHPLRLMLRRQILHAVQQGDERLAKAEAKFAAQQAARTPEQVQADEERVRRLRSLMAPVGGSRGRRWVELPSELTRETTLEYLALLGPDLGEEGEALLRRVARDVPHRLTPAVEGLLSGDGLASYRPSLLTELVEAYYLDDKREDDSWSYRHNLGIRKHQPRSAWPLSAYYRGPFLALLRTDFRNGVRCVNRLLNHAARVRVALLHDRLHDSTAPHHNAAWRTVLSITGEPRPYLGDSQVWFWYRGTGGGPYPCMSALQALELVCDDLIESGNPPASLIPILLDGCENLAMPALVLGLLVRHLEQAQDALDPFLTEPIVWELEFERVVAAESSRFSAQTPGIQSPERRKWSLREAAGRLVLSAHGERIAALRVLRERFVERARELVSGEGHDQGETLLLEDLATVRGWATALDPGTYHVVEHEGGIAIQQTLPEDLQEALEPASLDRDRALRGVGLTLRYASKRDVSTRPREVSLDELQEDLAMAHDLLDNPPSNSPPQLIDGLAAVAAGALELFFVAGKPVAMEDVVWSAKLLLDVATRYVETQGREYEFSFHILGADRSAARGLPFLLTPAADKIRAELLASGNSVTALIEILRWLLLNSSNETRLLLAQALDSTWHAQCDDERSGLCFHCQVLQLVEDSAMNCGLGNWDEKTKRRRAEPLRGPPHQTISTVPGDEIIVPRLSAAIRALGVAAYTPNCCQSRAGTLLEALLTAHRRGMTGGEQDYFRPETDILVAARALLIAAANGRQDLIHNSIEDYADHGSLLAELLKAVAAAAEENPAAAETARKLWPAVIDQVLAQIDAGHEILEHGYLEAAALAALIPNPTYEAAYLLRELESEPIQWTDLLAWRDQVERWLSYAAGSHECVDSLVQQLDTLSHEDQARMGLAWVGKLVEGDPDHVASRTWLLPDWLREVRPHLKNAEDEASWQRIVDMLIVAGDSRVADLAD